MTVKLEPEHGVSSLACINFIKSRLLVETYSDLSQDIDLVSQVTAPTTFSITYGLRGTSEELKLKSRFHRSVWQEILVSDTRYAQEPANRRGNVFSHIVQPMPDHRHSVQAEVHARCVLARNTPTKKERLSGKKRKN